MGWWVSYVARYTRIWLARDAVLLSADCQLYDSGHGLGGCIEPADSPEICAASKVGTDEESAVDKGRARAKWD
jgi:hypothetical protein